MPTSLRQKGTSSRNVWIATRARSGGDTGNGPCSTRHCVHSCNTHTHTHTHTHIPIALAADRYQGCESNPNCPPTQGGWEAFCGSGLGSVCIGPKPPKDFWLVPALAPPVPVKTGSTTASISPALHAIALSLSPIPSHLEHLDPARQQRRGQVALLRLLLKRHTRVRQGLLRDGRRQVERFVVRRRAQVGRKRIAHLRAHTLPWHRLRAGLAHTVQGKAIHVRILDEIR